MSQRIRGLHWMIIHNLAVINIEEVLFKKKCIPTIQNVENKFNFNKQFKILHIEKKSHT